MEREILTDHAQICNGSSRSTMEEKGVSNVKWAMTLLKEYRFMGFYVDARGCYVNTDCADEKLIHNYINIKDQRDNNNTMPSFSG